MWPSPSMSWPHCAPPPAAMHRPRQLTRGLLCSLQSTPTCCPLRLVSPNLPPPLWRTSPDHLALPPQVIVAAGDAVALLATDARACEAVDNVSAATATLQAAADGATAAQQSGVAKAVAALQVLRVAVLVPRLAAVVVHHGAVHALSEALTAVSSAPEGTTLQEDALVLLSGCVQQLIEAARELDASLSVEAPPPPPPLESDGTPGDSVVVSLSDTMATRALVPLSSARGKRCLVDEIASPELVQALVASVAATPSSRWGVLGCVLPPTPPMSSQPPCWCVHLQQARHWRRGAGNDPVQCRGRDGGHDVRGGDAERRRH